MSLSADVLLRMLDHPSLDPTFPHIPDVAFAHAARLINANINFQRQVVEHVEIKSKPPH